MSRPTYKFNDFPSAFDYCRAKGHPVKVYVREGVRWNLYKLFPSGRAELLAKGPMPEGAS